jgi:protein-disulfide isomerase
METCRMTDRRAFLSLAAAALGGLALPAFAQTAPAQASEDPRMGERGTGRADAPVTVIEYFSTTCPHCAAFHRETWPRVKRELVEAGRMRMVWRDFPLNQVDLMAFQVARALPAERYEGFIGTLLSTQDRWAFARNVDSRAELQKLAALAGMSRADFDAALADQGLVRAILEARLRGQQEHGVDSTPTFVFNGRKTPGNMAFDRFAQLVSEAR